MLSRMKRSSFFTADDETMKTVFLRSEKNRNLV